MAQLNFNNYIFEEMGDARTINWALVSSPIPVICIILLYIYIIYFFGPRFMKNKEPYSLKRFIQFYNLFQIIINFWIVFNVMTSGRPFMGVWRYCDSVDNIFGLNTEKQLKIIWLALLVKIVDLIETIVFILRKKTQQISLLHVYHHISTVIYVWLTLRYLIHASAVSFLALNCSVHVIMYAYYFLSTCGSNIQRILLPIKKWITVLQIIQISFITASGLLGLTLSCNNKVATYFGVITFLNGIPNLSLFAKFYWNSYKKSKTV